MPIVRLGSKIAHYIHIPKCGGSSIEEYLTKIDGSKIAFLDKGFASLERKWSNSSPQHIDGSSCERLFPVDFFDSTFAVVRNPLDRFWSAFNHKRLKTVDIDEGQCPDEFVQNELQWRAFQRGWMDNHFLPQCQFIPHGIHFTYFKLENGLDRVKTFIDQTLVGDDLSIAMPHVQQAAAQHSSHVLANSLSIESIERLFSIYADDFFNFDYSVEDTVKQMFVDAEEPSYSKQATSHTAVMGI